LLSWAVLTLALLAAAPARADNAAASPSKSVTFSVMTYNVEGLPWPVRSGRGAALKKIGFELAAMRSKGEEPDVVLIQEGFRDEVWDLIDESGYPYVARGPRKGQRDTNYLSGGARPDFRRVRYRAKGEGLGKWGSSGLWVLSNHPIEWVRSHAYRYCAGLDCLANKGVMLVAVHVPGLSVPVEIAGTHLNSKRASGVPRKRATQAHHLQVDELKHFMQADRTPGAPLIIGGDFNIMHSPDRFDYVMNEYPFAVVSRWCHERPKACDTQISYDGDAPWLDTQDLIGFLSGDAVEVIPTAVEATFDGASEPVLSDHDGYKVTFKLTPRE
jgi:endonuclease/exonuclease/phosphatase family metal-dependent hydrolase